MISAGMLGASSEGGGRVRSWRVGFKGTEREKSLSSKEREPTEGGREMLKRLCTRTKTAVYLSLGKGKERRDRNQELWAKSGHLAAFLGLVGVMGEGGISGTGLVGLLLQGCDLQTSHSPCWLGGPRFTTKKLHSTLDCQPNRTKQCLSQLQAVSLVLTHLRKTRTKSCLLDYNRPGSCYQGKSESVERRRG